MSYVSAVAELIEQTGHSNILNATAYTTIAEWEKEGIPLDLVSRSLVEISSQAPSQFNSFPHIAEIIESDFAVWLCTLARRTATA